MIARLTGVVAQKDDAAAILDVNGVGYLVQLSAASLAALPPRGERATVRIYTHVREDALQLFGFATEEEEDVFRALIAVNQVGPRAAQNILSGIEPRELARAVVDADVARLTKVPGIGKRIAERLVVELKDKLVVLARAAAPKSVRPAANGAGYKADQLEAALLGLGYKAAQAQAAVERMADAAGDRPLDDLLREALKLLRG